MKKTCLLVILLLFATILPAYRYGQNKVQTKRVEFSHLQTQHFDVYYVEGQDDFGHTAALMCEKSYYYLRDFFQSPIRFPIPVVFYSSQKEFSTTNIIYPLLSEGVGGFTEGWRNRVAIPFDGSYAKLERVLTHELTHAFINYLDKNDDSLLWGGGNSDLPFWLSEGLPEYLSVKGKDPYNRMFIQDIWQNNQLPDLSLVGGYTAYRMGESFLVWMDGRYGQGKVREFVFTIRRQRDMDKVCQKVFKLDFAELQDLWRHDMQVQSAALIDRPLPFTLGKNITEHKKNTSYYNSAPRYSPDGKQLLFVSDDDLRPGIVLYNIKTKKQRVLVRSELQDRFDSFHIQRVNPAWFSDGERFAFTAKTTEGDVIYVASAKNGRILSKYSLSEFSGVYELDVAPDGLSIAFSAQDDQQGDLFLLTLADGRVTHLTDDKYQDAAPRFSPDGRYIAFEREQPAKTGQHIFDGLVTNIWLYDTLDHSMQPLTADSTGCRAPFWHPDGRSLFFVEHSHGMPTLASIRLEDNTRADLPSPLLGIWDGDARVVDDSLNMVFTCYYNMGWDIYTTQTDTLVYMPIKPATPVATGEWNTYYQLDRWQNYGRVKRDYHDYQPVAITRNFNNYRSRNDFMEEDRREQVKADSLVRHYNFDLDEEPTQPNPPVQSRYKDRYILDRLYGGMAYASSYGAVGYLQMGLTDLMGNKAIGVQVMANGDLSESDFILSRLDLGGRTDYGTGIFHVNNESEYNVYFDDDDNVYAARKRERQYGIYALISYPFSRFARLDFENSFFGENAYFESWDNDKDKWVSGRRNDYMLWQPSLSYSFDNALYSSTGPISGYRSFLSVAQSVPLYKKIGDKTPQYSPLLDELSQQDTKEYTSVSAELRGYWFFAKRFALAARVAGDGSYGKSPETYDLDNLDSFRGQTSDDDKGDQRWLAQLELRYPFVDDLALGFPLPLRLTNIRGALFCDAASVWYRDEPYIGIKDGRLQDIKMAFGFGPRLNIGIAVLKVDISWTTDFVDSKKPYYYLSLWQEF